MELMLLTIKLLAGVGLFLFAMYLIEGALQNLSGRSFKLLLQRLTKNTFGAILGGTLVTAVLQSSSVVSLMVLAFIGTGLFKLRDALGIILGANLGTTLASWLVATIGFKVDIEIVAYPAICVGGLLLAISGSRQFWRQVSLFLLGFGLLFVGLSFMKTAMEGRVENFDFLRFADTSAFFLLIIGFILTNIVQSSSVVMALTLSAVHSGAIGFEPAAALVLGSEAGTTIKIVVGAIGGNAAKKRVALGNLLFNVVITVVTFFLLSELIWFITIVLQIEDPLIGLVTFSTFINLGGILIFAPFLRPFSTFLESFFKGSDGHVAAFIWSGGAGDPESAIDLLQKETEYFIQHCMLFNLKAFEVETSWLELSMKSNANFPDTRFVDQTLETQYDLLKVHQGEIQSFYLSLRSHRLDGQAFSLSQLVSAVRDSMFAAKVIKDIRGNIDDLLRSSKEIKFEFFLHHQKELEAFYRDLQGYIAAGEDLDFERFEQLLLQIQDNYTSSLQNFYNQVQVAPIEDRDITTVINFNRSLFASNKAILSAVKDIFLDDREIRPKSQVLGARH